MSSELMVLDVVHNCQYLPIVTESTNLGGEGGLRGGSVLFKKVDLFVELMVVKCITWY